MRFEARLESSRIGRKEQGGVVVPKGGRSVSASAQTRDGKRVTVVSVPNTQAINRCRGDSTF